MAFPGLEFDQGNTHKTAQGSDVAGPDVNDRSVQQQSIQAESDGEHVSDKINLQSTPDPTDSATASGPRQRKKLTCTHAGCGNKYYPSRYSTKILCSVHSGKKNKKLLASDQTGQQGGLPTPQQASTASTAPIAGGMQTAQQAADVAALKQGITFFGTRDAAIQGALAANPLQPLGIEDDDLAQIFRPSRAAYVARKAEEIFDAFQHAYESLSVDATTTAEKIDGFRSSQDELLRRIKKFMDTESGRQRASAAATIMMEEVIRVHEYGVPQSVVNKFMISYTPDLKTRFGERLETVRLAVQNNKTVALNVMKGLNIDILAHNPERFYSKKISNFKGNFVKGGDIKAGRQAHKTGNGVEKLEDNDLPEGSAAQEDVVARFGADAGSGAQQFQTQDSALAIDTPGAMNFDDQGEAEEEMRQFQPRSSINTTMAHPPTFGNKGKQAMTPSDTQAQMMPPPQMMQPPPVPTTSSKRKRKATEPAVEKPMTPFYLDSNGQPPRKKPSRGPGA